MHARWEALHAGLVRSVRSLQSNTAFTILKKQHAIFERFSDPGAVVAYLTAFDSDRDDKDTLLGILATLVQRHEHHELASALLWLGLWPGLSAIHRRSSQHFDEILSEIADAFTHEIAALDLTVVTRVAATLVRSTERRVLEGRRRERFEADTITPDVWALFERPPTWRKSRLGLLPTFDVDKDLAVLHAWLETVAGKDAELVLAVIVLEETQREVSARLGISHQAASKRFLRAVVRIRHHLEKYLSHFGLKTRV